MEFFPALPQPQYLSPSLEIVARSHWGGFTLALSGGFPATMNLLSDGTISDIKVTLGTTDVTNRGIVYVGSSEITLYADGKVKKATLKTDNIVTIRSTGYKLTADTVVNFAESGDFSSFDDAAVVVTRDSGTLTVGDFELTLINTNPVKINLIANGNVDSTTPYVENIKGRLTTAQTIPLKWYWWGV